MKFQCTRLFLGVLYAKSVNCSKPSLPANTKFRNFKEREKETTYRPCSFQCKYEEYMRSGFLFGRCKPCHVCDELVWIYELFAQCSQCMPLPGWMCLDTQITVLQFRCRWVSAFTLLQFRYFSAIAYRRRTVYVARTFHSGELALSQRERNSVWRGRRITLECRTVLSHRSRVAHESMLQLIAKAPNLEANNKQGNQCKQAARQSTTVCEFLFRLFATEETGTQQQSKEVSTVSDERQKKRHEARPREICAECAKTNSRKLRNCRKWLKVPNADESAETICRALRNNAIKERKL